MTFEEKMEIVINNYFKKECSVNTSIREAFEKGFRIGVKKGQSAQPEPHEGHWINGKCDLCGEHAPFWCMASTYHESNYCPNCGAKMKGERQK